MQIELKEIINKIDEDKLKDFLYINLINDSDLLNKFRLEFSSFFPRLSNENYKNKIYNAIYNCSDTRSHYIDYENTYKYEYAMFEFTNEAKKLVIDGDYNLAFTIVTLLLDSIPITEIDNSDGSTETVSDSCIEIIVSILDKIDTNNPLLKDILNYAINDIKSLYLYNYGIELKEILEYFINKKLYSNELKISLEESLKISKDKKYFCRKSYIEYLIKLYKLENKEDEIINLLSEYSFDDSVCMMYIDELLNKNQLQKAINLLKSKCNDQVRNRTYIYKLEQIYHDYKMNNEYKNILYDIFYKYSNNDFNVYIKIKNLYHDKEWEKEKNEIIKNIKNSQVLNEIYIEEKMYDDLFQNVTGNDMNYIIRYEEYLLPKYNKELLNIYKNSCLDAANKSNNRKLYKNVAVLFNHIIKMENSHDIVKSMMNEFKKEHFRSKAAMLDEFENIIDNLEQYYE